MPAKLDAMEEALHLQKNELKSLKTTQVTDWLFLLAKPTYIDLSFNIMAYLYSSIWATMCLSIKDTHLTHSPSIRATICPSIRPLYLPLKKGYLVPISP